MGEAVLRYSLLSQRCLINSHLANHRIHYCINQYGALVNCYHLSEGVRRRSLQAGNSLHLAVLTEQAPSLCTFRPAGTLKRDGSHILAIHCTEYIIIVCHILHIICNNNIVLYIALTQLRFPSLQANCFSVPQPWQHLRTCSLAHLSVTSCPCSRLYHC